MAHERLSVHSVTFSGATLPELDKHWRTLELRRDAAAAVGARTVYMLTGGRGALTWEQAAERFCAAVVPCMRAAERAGVALAIENAVEKRDDI